MIYLVRDILLGLMKRLIKLRESNLKVLITSATLDGEKVSRFFSNCPVLNVPGKLFPVEILHSSERPKSYIEASLKTALGMNHHCLLWLLKRYIDIFYFLVISLAYIYKSGGQCNPIIATHIPSFLDSPFRWFVHVF